MAQDLNVVALVGRLTAPCTLRTTNSGYAIVSFSIAVNKKKKQQDGSWQDQASFFDCTYFGKAAEGVSPWLQKGQQVGIQGSLEQQTWQDKATGQNRSKVVVIIDSLSLIGNSDQQNSSQNQRQPQRQQPNGYQQQNQAQRQYAPRPANQVVNKQPIVGPESFEDDEFNNIPF